MKKIIVLTLALLSGSNLLPAAGANGASSSSSAGAGAPTLAVDRLEKIGVDLAQFLQQLATYIVTEGDIPAAEKLKFEMELVSLIGLSKLNAIKKSLEEYENEKKQARAKLEADPLYQEYRTRMAAVAQGKEPDTDYLANYKKSRALENDSMRKISLIRKNILSEASTDLLVLYYTIYGQLLAKGSISANVPTPDQVQDIYNLDALTATRYFKLRQILGR